MRKLVFLISFMFCAWLSFSHAQTTFNKVYDRNDGVEGADNVVELDNSYLILGDGYEYLETNRWGGLRIVNIDFSGNIIWEKVYGKSGQIWLTIPRGVTEYNNHFYLSGFIYDSIKDDYDALLMKFDMQGDTIWKKEYGGNRIDGFYAIKEINEKIYLTGVNYNKGDIAGDVYVVKTDSTGNIEWDTTYGGAGVLDEGYSIDYTAEGNLIIGAGSAQFSPKPYSPWVIAIDTTGGYTMAKAIWHPNRV
mgnify:CR=1 FL=1